MEGILIVPVGPNGDTIKNVVHTVNSCKVREEYHLPVINKITFLESKDFDGRIKLDGQWLSSLEAYERISNSIESDVIEYRFRRIRNYSVEIPKLIMAAIKEVGKNKVILDLTGGKKNMTGTLYTAASISDIPNMIYVEVKKEPESHQFYSLDKSDSQILEKITLTKFQSMNEIESLASQNEIEFILYKKLAEDLFPEEKAELLELRIYFDNAIDNYFLAKNGNQNGINQCLNNLGLINERIILKTAVYLYSNLSEAYEKLENEKLLEKNKIDVNVIRKCGEFYRKYLLDQDRGIGSDERKQLGEKIGKVLKHLPGLYYMVKTVQTYRNRTAHDMGSTFKMSSAKLCMDIIINIVEAWNMDGILIEIVGGHS